jgi:hypothetical protein
MSTGISIIPSSSPSTDARVADHNGVTWTQHLWLSVHKRTVPNWRPPIVGEAGTNFCGSKAVAWSVQRVPEAVNFGFSRPKPLLFHLRTSSVIFESLSGSRSRPTTSQKI